MRDEGLKARKAKRHKRTMQSDPKHKKAPNLLDRDFSVMVPNRVWASDITYLPLKGSKAFLYLVVIQDLGTKEIVGWAVSKSMETELVGFPSFLGHKVNDDDSRLSRGILSTTPVGFHRCRPFQVQSASSRYHACPKPGGAPVSEEDRILSD